MTERDDLAPTEPPAGGAPSGGTPISGDPSLELFGNGWTPDREPPPDSYRGRHRAEDA